MHITLSAIAQLVGGQLQGDGHIRVTGLSGLQEAGPEDLSFLVSKRYLALLRESAAAAVLVPAEVAVTDRPSVVVADPSIAFARLIRHFFGESRPPFDGIHERCFVAGDARTGEDVKIGPFCAVSSGAVIGDRTVLYPGTFVDADVRIGRDCVIHPNVSLLRGTEVGDRVTIHAGTVIGSDGFGYYQSEGRHHKIPQIGIVEIGDDVEIGANVTVDRARLNRTRIGRGSKIDNLVQIAHNVTIEEDCIIISQAGVSGSTRIGAGSIIAGQVGVSGHLEVGKQVIIEAKAGVTKSVPDGTRVMGFPARPHMEFKRQQAAIGQLPALKRQLKDLIRRIERLEQ